MPAFDARRRELRDSLAAVQSQLSASESMRLAGVLEDYLTARDVALTMMWTYIADDGTEMLADEYAGKFRDMSRTATDKLDAMLDGLSTPSELAVRWSEQLSFSEFIFWGHLGGLKLAEARDAMVRDGGKVRELITVLDRKWQNLSEEDLKVEEAEQRAAQDLKDLLERALAEAMPYWVQAGAGVVVLRDAWKSVFSSITDHVKETLVGAGVPRNVVDALLTIASWANSAANMAQMAAKLGMEVGELMDWINRIRSINVGGLVQYRVGTLLDKETKQVVDYLDMACKGLKPLIEGAYNTHMTAFKAQLDNEGVIIVSYGGIRQQVDQFLRDCNLDSLRATHAAAVSAMDGIESSLGTDGMKRDWSDLRRMLKDAFDARRTTAEKAFDDFYRANDGRFLGGLSTDTERTLLEPDKWLVTTNGIVAVGLDTKLREWRERVTVINGGPKDAFDQVQNAFLGLPLDIRDQVQNGLNGYLNKQIREINTEADEAIKVLDNCALMVNARKISDDMDRSRLSQALRATIR
ncbi:MAG: hypothetical protein WAQ08_13575 [Aquabacterium sp.]|uniref:hypothetical protein n=1 Tax=Aquabacterium sp. TaxID=1872578 RepID=UPI003BAFB669